MKSEDRRNDVWDSVRCIAIDTGSNVSDDVDEMRQSVNVAVGTVRVPVSDAVSHGFNQKRWE